MDRRGRYRESAPPRAERVSPHYFADYSLLAGGIPLPHTHPEGGTEALRLRLAVPDDSDTVAALHAASWRTAYRGLLDEEFLEGPLDEYSRRRWRAWFTLIGGPPSHLVIAEREGIPVGFLCLVHCGGEFGDLIANIHVAAAHRSSGIGRRLMQEARRLVCQQGNDAMHLWVYSSNAGAIRFYDREGGIAESEQPHLAADGKMRPSWRYVWQNVSEQQSG